MPSPVWFTDFLFFFGTITSGTSIKTLEPYHEKLLILNLPNCNYRVEFEGNYQVKLELKLNNQNKWIPFPSLVQIFCETNICLAIRFSK